MCFGLPLCRKSGGFGRPIPPPAFGGLRRRHLAGEKAGTLWLLEGRYYLQLPLLRSGIRTLLEEYGESVACGPHFVAYAEEHGKRLSDNAASVIGGRLSAGRKEAG